MKIEKLNDNKIRIILNLQDLEEKHIDFHTFMSNSIESQDLFLDMLEKAETEVGFQTQDYRLMIEALATSDGNFILTVTRMSKELEASKGSKKYLTAKIKSPTPDKLLSIYEFGTFDEFCDFCTYLDKSNLSKCLPKFKQTSLYTYNSKYYLILNDLKIAVKDLKVFFYAITEFARHVQNDEMFERKLKEYGKLLIKQNSITTVLKYFKPEEAKM